MMVTWEMKRNEMLAMKAAEEVSITNRVQQELVGNIMKAWDKRWQQSSNCKTTKLFQSTLELSKSKEVCKNIRKVVRIYTVVGIYTDKCRYLLDLRFEEEEVHILCECEAFERARDLKMSRPERWNISEFER